MATSGTFTFNLEMAEIFDESFELCGVDPAAVTLRHIISAQRSINLMFASTWANRTIHQWKVVETTETLTQGLSSFTLPAGTIDVTQAVLKRSSVEIPIVVISRQEWRDIPDKTTQGRPDRFWVDRQISLPVFNYWPVAENSTDQIVYWRMQEIEDVTIEISQNPDAPKRWLDAVCKGLAARLAVKYAPDRVSMLKGEASEALDLAEDEDRERGPTVIRADMSYRGRRW